MIDDEEVIELDLPVGTRLCDVGREEKLSRPSNSFPGQIIRLARLLLMLGSAFLGALSGLGSEMS
jgi:hypothetical protein